MRPTPHFWALRDPNMHPALDVAAYHQMREPGNSFDFAEGGTAAGPRGLVCGAVQPPICRIAPAGPL